MSEKRNCLYYGDNLEILRKYIADNSIDMVYLDPPFNSKADYNVLFRESTGEESHAQIQAFSDFWHWDLEARRAYDFLTTHTSNLNVANLTQSLYNILGKNDMLAYLVMMGVRLVELQRVLKPTGSLFLHCDTTASHYLKLMLDAVFDARNFRNEIVWKRFNFHADAKRFGKVADRILFYTKTDDYKFNRQMAPYREDYVKSKFTHQDEDGRKFRLDNLNPPGGRGPVYEFHGVTRAWRYTKEKMLQLEKEKRIYTKSKVPQLKRYLDELEARGGGAVHEIWDDIPGINSMAKERLGYPTQKPSRLLERIIATASDEKDWVLDPFCGCGTAIIAAEKLRRHWIGIDVTYLAINLIKNRLRDSFPQVSFDVEGEPRDMGAANELAKDRYQFQWWALSLVGAAPYGASGSQPREGRKGADTGIDGWMRFHDGPEGNVETIIVQVKSGHVGVKDIREFRDVLQKRKAAIGLFITLENPTRDMINESKQTDPYVSPRWRHEFPKVQILTIEELLRGVRPNIPTTINLYKEAPDEKRIAETQQSLLG